MTTLGHEWSPPADLVERAAMTRLLDDLELDGYDALWRWSTADVGRFWTTIWERFEVVADGDPSIALADAEMPGASWFPHTSLSFAEHVFRDKDPAAVAVWHASELRNLAAWTWADLSAATARVRAGLRRLGVGRGDRVVAYMPNIPETLAAFLATTSLGAIWSCCAPELGARTVLDRFAQIEPTVLLAVDGYRYRGRNFDRTEIVAELAAALPTLRHVVRLPYLTEEGDWDDAFPATEEPLAFERVPFDHPLWILYSSGTTGLPKAIVHGHGGILLEHLKAWHLHHDLAAGERVLWFTTTTWMMWNYLVSALLVPAAIVLYDGYPGGDVLWDLCADAGVTMLGVSAAFLHGCMKGDVAPRRGRDLSRLRKVGSTGSPLAPEADGWVRRELGDDTWLFSVSGGTDVASGFVGGCPLLPARPGELQCRCLGVAVEAWDDDGRSIVDGVGELVITKPMPSMPVRFWGDPDGQLYRDAYFSAFPGVWRHGDWIKITASGSAVVYGRSDATINRGGIRMGTAEIYATVLALDPVADALVVDVPALDDPGAAWMPLFVALERDASLSDDLAAEIRARIARDCSPRHVPDEIVAVPAVPRTLTGKPLEVPVKRLLMGHDPERAANRDALADPAALDWFVAFAASRGLVSGSQ